MAEHPNFWEDIFPLFTEGDIACMRGQGVLLANADWWKNEDNFGSAVRMLEAQKMPLGGIPWDQESIEKLKKWKDKGFPEGERPKDE